MDNSCYCKNCKYWKTHADSPEKWSRAYNADDVCRPHDHDLDERMRFNFEVRICTNPKLFFHERPLERDGFAVVDGSEYYAALITAENFSCILHECIKGRKKVNV